MPSHSVKQAKTMSAIAHGWKPKGKAAGIPVKVAKEFHSADKGHKYGKGGGSKGYDRSSHRPGNPHPAIDGGFSKEQVRRHVREHMQMTGEKTNFAKEVREHMGHRGAPKSSGKGYARSSHHADHFKK